MFKKELIRLRKANKFLEVSLANEKTKTLCPVKRAKIKEKIKLIFELREEFSSIKLDTWLKISNLQKNLLWMGRIASNIWPKRKRIKKSYQKYICRIKWDLRLVVNEFIGLWGRGFEMHTGFQDSGILVFSKV